MALDEEISLLFENYLDNQLTDAERQAFEIRLEEDPSFASDFETYKEISQYLANQFSEERNLLKKQLEQFSAAELPQASEIKKPNTSRVIKIRRWQIGIAASIAIILGVFFVQMGGGLQQRDFLFSDNITLTQRSDDTQPVRQAEMSFNNENYSEAIGHFQAILEAYPNNTEVQFYKAIAHDALGQYKASDELFSELSRGGSIYRHKAAYYWAVSLWQQNKTARAKTILNDIPRNAEEYKLAKRLLKRL